MQPHDPQRGHIQPPQRSAVPEPISRAPAAQPVATTQTSDAHRASAANIARSNIDQIYQSDPAVQVPVTEIQPVASQPIQQTTTQPAATEQPAVQPELQPSQVAANPYDRVHNEDHLVAHDDTWKTYHSAWQNYYQQYFYRYYAGHLSQKDAEVRAAKAVAEHARSEAEKASSKSNETDGVLTEDEALDTLRGQIRSKVSESAKKVRKSRHFMPVIAGLSVMLIFLALQYNTQIVGALSGFVSPGSIDPTDIIVDTSIDVPVGEESRLIIPKINVNEPIIWDAKNDQASQLKAMESGVAYFGVPGANSRPGQVGNTPLAAHSANNLLEAGDHKFVFVHLPMLVEGDTVYVTYKEVRYTYKVTKKREVQPNDVASLVYTGDKPVITLITCVPVGHASRRLLVTAEQISPDPDAASKAPESSTNTTEPAQMTGNSPTLFERIFGG